MTVTATEGAAGTEGTGGEGGEGATGEVGGEKVVDYQADAEKWKAMSRKHEAQAKSNADAAKKLAEIEEASKTEVQKLTDASIVAGKRAEEAESKALRYEIALEKSVPGKLMKFLSGGTREEIEASADELIEATKPDTGEEESTTGKPRERLRAGAASSETGPEEMDPRKLAASFPRM